MLDAGYSMLVEGNREVRELISVLQHPQTRLFLRKAYAKKGKTMNKTKYRISIGLIWMFTVGSVSGAEMVYDVRDYGAKADGKTMCTKSIQRAI